MYNFKSFTDKKQREAKKELKILKQMLENQNFHVIDKLDDSDPYIYVSAPKDLSFGGIRIYKLGERDICFRVQKESDTMPFGKSYLLNISEIYNDFLSEKPDEEKAAHRVIEEIGKEIKRFFSESGKAEEKIREKSMETKGHKDPYSRVIATPDVSDYSSKIFSKAN